MDAMEHSRNLPLIPVKPLEEGGIFLAGGGAPLSTSLARHSAHVLRDGSCLVGDQQCTKSSPIHQIDCLHAPVATRNVGNQKFGHDTSALL